MRRRRIPLLLAALSLVAVGLTATPAGAEITPKEPFSDTDSFSYSDCGYPITADVQREGTVSYRVGKHGRESVFFARGNVTYREVHTNTLTGEQFVVRGHSSFRDVKATHVEGTRYEVTQQVTGQPFVVEDSSGRVVARDRGLLRFTIVIDTGGDDSPGSEFVDFLGVEVRGPHPGFEASFCRFAGDLVGISDSSDRYTLRAEGTTDSPLGYAEYLPSDYADDGQSPLLIFLHGFGESGDGSVDQLERLTATAIPAYIAFDGWPDERPFVVLAPQHEVVDESSPPCFTPEEIQSFLDYAVDAYDVDQQRVYVTGLSCGAIGAWNYLAEYGGDRLAAVVPIAGDGRAAWEAVGCQLGDVPLWAFHGSADDVVDPQGSIEPVTTTAGLHLAPSTGRAPHRLPGRRPRFLDDHLRVGRRERHLRLDAEPQQPVTGTFPVIGRAHVLPACDWHARRAVLPPLQAMAGSARRGGSAQARAVAWTPGSTSAFAPRPSTCIEY
jgi:predicted esterase